MDEQNNEVQQSEQQGANEPTMQEQMQKNEQAQAPNQAEATEQVQQQTE